MTRVVVVIGPTASGKSSLAIELARAFDGEVVSADSRQVYRGLDIGTGKVTKTETKGVPHHLLDVAAPAKIFTAADFVRHGRAAIANISNRGKVPIICGGTGFYIDALLGKITLPEVPANKTLRETLVGKPASALLEILIAIDPERAAAMNESDSKNPVRLIRAIEIAYATPFTKQKHEAPVYETLWIGIDPPQEMLFRKIADRLHARIRSGMIAEAKRLHARGLSYKRMEMLGLEYRYLARLLQKQITRAEFEIQLASQIRGYAKRQITYWKRNGEISWFPSGTDARIMPLVRQWLEDTVQ